MAEARFSTAGGGEVGLVCRFVTHPSCLHHSDCERSGCIAKERERLVAENP